jgi:hypothetical protein
MPTRVQAPDGSIVEFPDGMGDEQIVAVMRREYGGPDTRPKSQALGFFKGAMKPLDNAAMALENTAQRFGVPTDRINDALGMPSAVEATEQRQRAIARSPNRPAVAGEIAGNIFGTVPAMAVSKNPIVQGAAAGALLTDNRNPFGIGVDAAMGAGLSWGAGKVIDGVSDVIAPAIDPAVRRLKDAGVRLTPGMVKGGKAMTREDKLLSRPVVGGAVASARQQTQTTFNTAAVNEALKPLGKKVPSAVRPGFDALDYAKGEISRAYDTVIPNLSVQINGQQFAQNIAPVARNLKPAEQKQLRQIVSNELGNGQLAGDALKRAQSQVRRLAGKFSRSQDANQQMLGEALRAVDDELTGAMLAQNPQFAPQLQRVNEAYRGYRIVADAAGRADDGLINTNQLKQAVRRGDFSKSKDQSARKKAFMQEFANDARTVIPAKTPDSGTAGRLMAANPFAYVGGAKDALQFNASDMIQQFRLAPRPAAAAPAARAVRRLKGPFATGVVAASHQSGN